MPDAIALGVALFVFWGGALYGNVVGFSAGI